MKIYTKTGDKGTTSLIGGARVKKNHNRIDAYGTVDELNSWIGWVADQDINAPRRPLLKEIQDRLFTVGSALASDPEGSFKLLPDLHPEDITALENAMDVMDAALPALSHFILPGGNQAISGCHIARTVCRRAERAIITLDDEAPVDVLVIKYINRLSDYLFVLSRAMAQDMGAEVITWQPRLPKDNKPAADSK